MNKKSIKKSSSIGKKKRKLNENSEQSDKMTLFDYILFNPTDNPMPKNENRSNNSFTSQTENESIDDTNSEEAAEEVDLDQNNLESDHEESRSESPINCPQLKFDASGNIILDTPTFETEASKKARENDYKNVEVIQEDDIVKEYNKRRGRGCDWTLNETKRFYKALATFGTDFSLMQPLLSWRTRTELKQKFKKEEKKNKDLIDKALMGSLQFDISEFDDSTFDIEEDRKQSKQKKLNKLKELLKEKSNKEKLLAKIKKKQQKENDKKSKKTLKETFKKNRKNIKKQKEPTLISLDNGEIVIEITLKGNNKRNTDNDNVEANDSVGIDETEDASTFESNISMDVVETADTAGMDENSEDLVSENEYTENIVLNEGDIDQNQINLKSNSMIPKNEHFPSS